MVWKPHVTVAAIAHHAGEFLLVEEYAGGQLVLNQPAGHLEPGESLADAVIRETREESAWDFRPQAIVGVYRWFSARRNETFLRVCFCGEVWNHQPDQPLDDGIQRALWVDPETLRASPGRLRSPLVMRGIDDFQAGCRYPLDLFQDVIAD
ncbi:NUDIX hydrolase [Aquisalimonas asiatica]|uniref:Phosphatase NudJ n=1 Tax=Aquisalimonas asiatica TaxID=406100 RepID=A0A1H8QB53_9GAMM|nr:NUDIX hydrolase [Aquisalimonas asiatica]SEO51154.1 ADP-ribose pyrophosphatase YjhB, NUDIX family [Aquisalimonas asiatica]